MKRTDERGKILSLLPETLPAEIQKIMLCEAANDLGKAEFLVYKRESWAPSFDMEIGWPDLSEEIRPCWAAACRCGVCGYTWHSGWQDGALLVSVGPDGCYSGIPESYEAEKICEGETAVCMNCESILLAMPKASLRNGRTYQTLAVRVENLERYTAVIYWMLRRSVDAEGNSQYDVRPWAAAVVGTDGAIYRFTHAKAGYYGKRSFADGWKENPRMGEPLRSRYYNWEGLHHTGRGGLFMTKVPDQRGMTGEKTALAEYIAGGGVYPTIYLLRQRKFKSLENLVRAGWVFTIDSALSDEARENARAGERLRQIADFSRSKPRDMLRMPREQVTRLGMRCWEWKTAALWLKSGLPDPMAFDTLDRLYGTYALEQMLEAVGAAELPRLDAYLHSQQRRGEIRGLSEGVTIYRDYRRMLANVGGGNSQTELWPPHLRRAHDRLIPLSRDAEKHKLDPVFAALREKWRALEWNDGGICAFLPSKAADLVQEGRVLHHCVGGYSSQHCGGELIVFIRHARRPERSWFTLNIDTTGSQWREIQLHGYGNEHAHGKLLKIPSEVRAFVDRWEKEVLTPVFRQIKREEAARERKGKARVRIPA